MLVFDRENDSDQALMQFRDGNRSLTVGTTAGAVPKADGVKQNVGAVNGTLVTTDNGNTLLLWDCPDRHHWITGTMDADDLATVAGYDTRATVAQTRFSAIEEGSRPGVRYRT